MGNDGGSFVQRTEAVKLKQDARAKAIHLPERFSTTSMANLFPYQRTSRRAVGIRCIRTLVQLFRNCRITIKQERFRECSGCG